jgi:predicted nucleotidyltransferase
MSLASDRQRIELTAEELEIVRHILQDHLSRYVVWAFGSRVIGGAKPYSDLDIAVITSEPLSLAAMADVKAAFDSSDLVFKVDIVDWATTSDSFRKIIAAGKYVLQADEI